MLSYISSSIPSFLIYISWILVLLKIILVITTGRCKSMKCLVGKTALVTGGNTGIGYQVALYLASRGCRVIIANRTDATAAKERIIQETNNRNIVTKHVDLASFESVRALAKDLNETEERLDILVNNAGVGYGGNKHTEDGLDATMQINYFSHFLLTHLLIDLLKKSAPSRIVFVSSLACFFNRIRPKELNFPEGHPNTSFYSSIVYSNSKFCQLAATKGFARRLAGADVRCNVVHPGCVKTGIFDKIDVDIYRIIRIIIGIGTFFFAKSVQDGAEPVLHVALSRECGQMSGSFYVDCIRFFEPPSLKTKLVDEIWEESEKLVKLQDHEKLSM